MYKNILKYLSEDFHKALLWHRPVVLVKPDVFPSLSHLQAEASANKNNEVT